MISLGRMRWRADGAIFVHVQFDVRCDFVVRDCRRLLRRGCLIVLLGIILLLSCSRGGFVFMIAQIDKFIL